MATRKTPKATSNTSGAPARAKVSVKKSSLKDLSASRTATAVKGGANYSRAVSGTK